MKNIIGNKYQKLTVVGRDGTSGHETTWLCVCDCGKSVVVKKSPLLSGKKIDCGCGFKERRSRQNAVDIMGVKFGNLTVLERKFGSSYHGNALWHCMCECGDISEYHSKQLRLGTATHCGCLTFKRQLTDEQMAFLYGTLLGDGCLVRRKNVANLRVSHSVKQIAFVKWKHSLMGEMSNNIKEVYNGGYGGNLVKFETFGLKQFRDIYDFIYPLGKKTVTEKWLSLIENPLSLAVWYMDDGSMALKTGSTYFHTEGFPKNQVELLVEWLNDKWGILCNTRDYRGYSVIALRAEGRRKLHSIIESYIIPEMKYKIGCHYDRAR